MSDNDRSTENDSPDDVIRVAAYYKWLDAGRPDGRDLDFWCQAEQERALLQHAIAKPSPDEAPAHRAVIVRPKAFFSPARRGNREKPASATSRHNA
ncbi:MAG TPA: DUF2934 domain-containing protein [Pirellulales bacterium]|nr:DUF2934 domain-containing protein [Pirellulales bacterium]